MAISIEYWIWVSTSVLQVNGDLLNIKKYIECESKNYWILLHSGNDGRRDSDHGMVRFAAVLSGVNDKVQRYLRLACIWPESNFCALSSFELVYRRETRYFSCLWRSCWNSCVPLSQVLGFTPEALHVGEIKLHLWRFPGPCQCSLLRQRANGQNVGYIHQAPGRKTHYINPCWSKPFALLVDVENFFFFKTGATTIPTRFFLRTSNFRLRLGCS